MGKIRILSDEVASQVAAGEVVERPASLVKELVENSLDAGATHVVVEFARGGTRLVSVQDNGCGMDREDALLCLERHGTSKIREGNDLAMVRTMGFRGEALPSIASVSRFRLATREPQADVGTEVLVAGGKVETVREAGLPAGTLIEVRDLFFNLPARRKFLRGEDTESAHIVQGLQAMALANPGVAFECRREGRTVLNLPRAETLAVRIRDLFGADHLGRLAEVDPVVGEGFEISGFLGKPGEGRRDRAQQYVILNGRPIHCPAVQNSLREACAGTLGPGVHPLAVLRVEMDPELVDCNVHPAKREVRLRQPEPLRRAVFEVARKSLERSREGWARQFAPAPAPVSPVVAAPALAVVSPPRELSFTQRPAPAPMAAPVPPPVPEEEPERFRILGQAGGHFLILEGGEGLVLLDTRSASERVLFEKLLAQMEDGSAPSQRLLMPEVLEFPPREHAWITEHLEDLQAVGFGLEPFGGTTLKMEAVPAFALAQGPRQFLHDMAASLRAAGKLPPGRGLREVLARSVSRLAVEGKWDGNPERGRRLIAELLKCELPYASPSGRPTMIQFSFAELERKFGRE